MSVLIECIRLGSKAICIMYVRCYWASTPRGKEEREGLALNTADGVFNDKIPNEIAKCMSLIKHNNEFDSDALPKTKPYG
jgi:hypothetical protein